MQFQLAFLQLHLVPQPLILLQLHFSSSRQAWLATGRVVQTGVHAFVDSSQLQPQDSGLGFSCLGISLDVHMLAWYIDLSEY